MTTLQWVLTIIPAIVALYAYVVYPTLLWLVVRARKREAVKRTSGHPYVSVVVPAYNEERQIAGAIDALLTQDYPPERLQILILSDASTDATDEIVAGYASRGVELLRMPERSGKTKAENIACARLRGEIVVNTDSSIRLHKAAVRELVAHMSDPAVGVATGRDVSISALDHTANLTEAGYVNYEMRVRALETRTGGIVGASGSCYAIRVDLHRIAIPDNLSRDFSSALTARSHGFRSVSVDEAICFVPRTSSLQREYRRKVRTISRGMETLYHHRQLLDPVRYGSFAWKLFSHKICRWAVPVSIVPGIVGLALLARDHLWARGVLLVGVGVALLAVAGAVWPVRRRMPRLVSVAAFGVSANLAVLHALLRALAGHHDHVWEPTRRTA
ncbi:MAG TPA: glycosyltransferase [Gemmatimonadaceae bacterium]|jgi:cellulose synthase/poly-beta-1,6-N-acetylglucosamine synthase-like glycosyltransferase